MGLAKRGRIPPPAKAVDSLIGKGTEVEGKIKVGGTLRVDGTVSGEVEASGEVVVGEGGLLAATVKAAELSISGEVRGNVETSGRLELTRTGHLYGDAKVGVLSIEDGAVFTGRCETVQQARED